MKTTFIKTSDKDTKENLLKLGYKLIDQSAGLYTFLNDRPVMFDENIQKNIVFSDRIQI